MAVLTLMSMLAASVATVSNTSKPHIITLVVDDLGFHDTQIHNPASFMTPHFGELSKQGITLMRHHTYKFCSPTVREFAGV